MKLHRQVAAQRSGQGFSLLEILVSTAILGAVLIVIASAIGTMQNTWMKVRAKSDVFRGARAAVETVTRRVSMATLSSRWEAQAGQSNQSDIAYIEESDLHFCCAPLKAMPKASGNLAGHILFFQAPFGVDNVSERTRDELRHDRLSNALNAWGYFVELGSDDLDRPSFMRSDSSRTPAKQRFRLMEYRQPTSELALFNPGPNETLKPALASQKGKDGVRKWISDVIGKGSIDRRDVSVVADNVVAFLVRPVRGGRADGGANDAQKYALAPDLEYDSRRFQWDENTDLAVKTRHRLPPALELTFVVTTEESWERQGANAAGSLLQQVKNAVVGRFGDATRFESDLRQLRETLDKARIDYRVIVTTVPLAEGRKERLQ